MYVISVYCPRDFKEQVKAAMFAAGAGVQGNYENCCFEYEGVGQFKAKINADPFIGKIGNLEKVEEIKIEMVCIAERVAQVLSALRNAHPYEEPAFHVLKNESSLFEAN